MMHRVQFEDWVPFPIERVFLFFANPENLPRLMPPVTDTRVHRFDSFLRHLQSMSRNGRPSPGLGRRLTLPFVCSPTFHFAHDGLRALRNSSGTVSLPIFK